MIQPEQGSEDDVYYSREETSTDRGENIEYPEEEDVGPLTSQDTPTCLANKEAARVSLGLAAHGYDLPRANPFAKMGDTGFTSSKVFEHACDYCPDCSYRQVRIFGMPYYLTFKGKSMVVL